MKRKLIIILVIITFIIIAIGCYYTHSIKQRHILKEKIDFYQSIADSEIEWIKGLQLSNGAFAFRLEEGEAARINPYFADYTAMALLRAGDGKVYAEEVKRYLDWHFDHLNDSKTDKNGIDGTIYEYEAKLKNGIVASETTTKKYDSVDSYAASFLDLLWDYYNYTGDKEYLIKHYDKILRVINAINATMDDGLTIAKPEYPVKYLMDNAEVYEGLVCVASLYDKVFLPGLKKNTDEYEDAEKICKTLKKQKDILYEKLEDKMWNESDKHYMVGIQKGGKAITGFDWDDFYPDAASQLFPIIHGVLDKKSDRAKYLYKAFGNHYAWENFDYYTKGNADFYWGRLAFAASVMEDEDKVRTYMAYYSENVMPEHKKPLYNADAAWVVLASEKMIDLYRGKMRWLLPEL